MYNSSKLFTVIPSGSIFVNIYYRHYGRIANGLYDMIIDLQEITDLYIFVQELFLRQEALHMLNKVIQK